MWTPSMCSRSPAFSFPGLQKLGRGLGPKRGNAFTSFESTVADSHQGVWQGAQEETFSWKVYKNP